MRITVTRLTQNNPAPPITERLLSTSNALTARGKSELYEKGDNRNIHTITLPYENLIKPGQLGEINDTEQGEVFRAKCTSVNITIGEIDIDTTITVEEIV